MSMNPVKYAEIFSTKSNSSSDAMKFKTEKTEHVNVSIIEPSATLNNCTKDVQEDEQYILNGPYRCYGKINKDSAKQVSELFQIQKVCRCSKLIVMQSGNRNG